jgi:hypothetical protein
MALPQLDKEQVSRSNSMRRRQAAAEIAWLAGREGSRVGWPSLMELREQRIREAAYCRAERRGFAPGHELEDWLDAEQEVDRASRPLPQR